MGMRRGFRPGKARRFVWHGSLRWSGFPARNSAQGCPAMEGSLVAGRSPGRPFVCFVPAHLESRKLIAMLRSNLKRAEGTVTIAV